MHLDLSIDTYQDMYQIRYGVNRPYDGAKILVRSDHFSKLLSLRANEPLDLDLPLYFFDSRNSTIRVTASDDLGHRIGQATRSRDSLTSMQGIDKLIAIYCLNDNQCQDVQKQLPLPGTEFAIDQKDPTVKMRLNFAILNRPETHSWVYSAASTVLVAGPVSGLSPDQRMAFEDYARNGGELILLEDLARDPSFMAAYRNGAPSGNSIRVGKGELIRMQELGNQSLKKYLTTLTRAAKNNQLFDSSYDGFGYSTLLSRVGVSFEFPSFRWMLIGFGAYILFAGLLNFA
ncbi:MAG: hypothetical protein WB997_05690, partial [Candidatus Acidiferrales bacterium]